jgi:hypothetical protein
MLERYNFSLLQKFNLIRLIAYVYLHFFNGFVHLSRGVKTSPMELQTHVPSFHGLTQPLRRKLQFRSERRQSFRTQHDVIFRLSHYKTRT